MYARGIRAAVHCSHALASTETQLSSKALFKISVPDTVGVSGDRCAPTPLVFHAAPVIASQERHHDEYVVLLVVFLFVLNTP